MSTQQFLLAGVAASALALSAGQAMAQTPTATAAASVAEVVVTADKVGLLERKPNDTILGFNKPLLDTARSATLISDTTIERYGIKTVDNLVEIAPGTFTASFYGVPGSLNIRGTYAENYFQGFKLIENLGTYTTPLGDASRIDVVRGPPSPIYGPGKVGGFLNFVPKTAEGDHGAFLASPTGEIEASVGGYDAWNVNGQFGTPFSVGGHDGGVYLYAEVDNGDHYYYGIHPKHQMGEISLKFDVAPTWTLEADAMLYHSTGDVQTPGWNRLTQDLVDNGTYITGRDTTVQPSAGRPYLTPNDTVGYAGYPYIYTATGAGLYAAYYGFPYPTDPRFTLDSNVGTTQLSRRTVYISSYDFSKTWVPTAYLSLDKSFADDSVLKLQGFFNRLDNQRFVSYGFPAWFRSNVIEGRASYIDKFDAFGGHLTFDNVIGVGDRYSWSRDMQSYNSGVIALDRRDISQGASPSDIICDPFVVGIKDDSFPSDCLGWEGDVHSTVNDVGGFFTSDIMLDKRLDLTLGGRYDHYSVKSSDTGILPYEAAGPVSASKWKGTYTASLSYKLPFGLMPYGTLAQSSALEYGQASDIATSLITSGGWEKTSQLAEAGIKFQWFGGRLVGSADVYRQTRPVVNGQPPALDVVNTIGRGEELEIRWVATQNLSFTFAGDMQHTEVVGPDNSFQYIPSWVVCGFTTSCLTSNYGGGYAVYSFSSLPGRAGNYEYTPIPHGVYSVFANYVSDKYSWGSAGGTFGFTHASKTSGTLPGAVVYPDYYVFNLSLFYRLGSFEADLNVDNLFDKLYFTPDADTYVNLGALPSKGRLWRLTVKHTF